MATRSGGSAAPNLAPLAPTLAGLSASESAALDQIAALATKWTGVQFDQRHESMLRSRLQTRMREVGSQSFAEYLRYAEANLDAEAKKIIALLTTHHTYFFREFAHFEHLAKVGLPAAVARARAQRRKTIRIWSAACSRGQEAYSIAMWMEAKLPEIAPEMGYEILGSDVDAESVEAARNGVYKFAELKEAPMALLEGHWARGTGEIRDFVKAKGRIRQSCRFETDNLISLKRPSTDRFDFIFCRNVFIYFSPQQTAQIAKQLVARLEDGGLLYVGISESLHGSGVQAKSIGPSVYQKPDPAAEKASEKKAPGASAPVAAPIGVRAPDGPTAAPEPARPLRVFCVDDSPSVLKLLEKILSKDAGFEVAGTAANGLQAKDKLAAAGKVDAVTLDIHMPEQDGIAYLRANFGSNHPPVVMVTSASRESSGLALEALELGASDFVEKPAMAKLEERAEEIRTKIKMAAAARAKKKVAAGHSLDREFDAKKPPAIASPERKLCLFVSYGLEPAPRIVAAAKDALAAKPAAPLAIVVDAAPAALDALKSKLSQIAPGKVIGADSAQAKAGALAPGEIGVFSWDEGVAWLAAAKDRFERSAVCAFGDVPAKAADRIAGAVPSKACAWFLEDVGTGAGAAALSRRAKDVGPSTSFAYFAAAHLCEPK